MFGTDGTIRNYYDTYGLGEPVNETMAIPDGGLNYTQYWFSTAD